MKSSLPIVGLAAVIILGGLYFMTNKPPQQVAVTPPVENNTIASPEPSTTASVKTIEVEAGSFYYKPATMTVKKGEKVRIVMKAVSMMHDFNIDELGVKMPIVKNGDTGTVEFTPDKVGTFEYYCSVAQHRANGQVGKLTVQE